MFTKTTMFFDEEVVTSLLPLVSGQTIVAPEPSPPAGVRYGGTNYWVNEDPRPTKKEALKKIQQFRDRRDRIVRTIGLLPPELVDTEPFRRATPWWVVVPFYIAPELAEVLIEIDPLDRLED